ncbi:ABC transporter substrate-binding protein [Methanospirillum lacunae]|uniref:Uncharacterized protein n=1 Tax=Methanospirillum lacunae TaxID=668570 RepID=A0A2V2MX89_9EURY|nr:ABC transporter substrate-binding protein [Methanospirillum lacunae]PWR70016.1 hypothetical protein DK846_16445 [Methanospirillum lacunae]
MRVGFIPLLCGLLCILLFILSGLPVGHELAGTGAKPTVKFVYASSGIMPQLLNTSQVDAFIVWESVVSTAKLGKIGTVIARDGDIPPDHKWENAACNVLVMRNNFVEQYPEIAALLSAVTIAGNHQIEKDPDTARNITANWVYGSKPIRSAGLYLNPIDVENQAFQYITFTSSAPLPDISRLKSSMDEDSSQMKVDYINGSVMLRAQELINGSSPVLSNDPPVVRIGYLPSSDLYAPLYVTIMSHKEICDTYGFCLAPDSGTSGRPTGASLLYHNQTAAKVVLLPGSVGGGVMTGLGQEAMEAAYIGSVPSELQISMGNDASVIQSINAGGSGLIVDNSAPCTDWNSFISWVKDRSAKGNPVIVAVPQSSIQEEMMREAFDYEGINILLYGIPPRWSVNGS